MVASFNHFPAIAEAMHNAESQIVRKTAIDLAGAMQAFMRANGQIDTGFMINSAYAVTNKESTYSSAGAPTKQGQHLLPEVEKPDNDLTAYAAIGAYYAVYQNYGTRFLPARLFLEPAIEEVRPGFEAALGKIEATIKGSIS